MSTWIQWERWWRFPDLIITLEERALDEMKNGLPANAGEPLVHALAALRLRDLSELFLPDRERLRLACQVWDMFSALEPPLKQNAQRWEYGVLRPIFTSKEQVGPDRWDSPHPWEAPLSAAMIHVNEEAMSQWPSWLGRVKSGAFRIESRLGCCDYVFVTQPMSPWARELRGRHTASRERARGLQNPRVPTARWKDRGHSKEVERMAGSIRLEEKKLRSAEEVRGSVREQGC